MDEYVEVLEGPSDDELHIENDTTETDSDSEKNEEQKLNDPKPVVERRYPTRERRPPPTRMYSALSKVSSEDSLKVSEALESAEKENWKAAIEKELKPLESAWTYEVVNRPEQYKVLHN